MCRTHTHTHTGQVKHFIETTRKRGNIIFILLKGQYVRNHEKWSKSGQNWSNWKKWKNGQNFCVDIN